jgi:mycofactocin system creatininase family protein
MTENRAPTSNEISNGTKILVLLLGSWEQHGPHLPLDTDSVIISRVVQDALDHSDVSAEHFLCAPLLPITASDEHEGFSGGLSTGTDALVNSVVSICRSAQSWAVGTLIANGHGGNYDALQKITSALEYEKITHSVWTLPSYAGGDMHAGHTETSLMLHISPHSVRTELIDSVEAITANIDQLRNSGVKGVAPSGVLGNPSTASVQHGEEVLNLYVQSLVQRMQTCSSDWLHFPA